MSELSATNVDIARETFDWTTMLSPEAEVRLREMQRAPQKEITCDRCGRVFMGGAGLSAHERYCKP